MQSKTRQNLLAFVGLLLLIAIGWALFVLVRGTFRVFESLKSDIAVAIIAAGCTVLVSILTIVVGKAYEAREKIQNQHREKKIPVYEDLLRFIFRVLQGTKTGNAPTEQEVIEFLTGFNQRMMVWASDEVLAAWVAWWRAISPQSASTAPPLNALLLYEKLIFAIRRDLGHKNKKMTSGDVLRLFVNDIDDHLRPTAGK